MELIVFLFVLGFFTLVLVGVAVASSKGDAKKAYLESLEKLKRDPHNPDLRDAAIMMGRKYASKGVIGFDETAITNDIQAAVARITLHAAGQAERKPTIEDRLKRLDDLLGKQLITEQEHRTQRQKILDEL
jgi:hypothetical protein